MRPRRGTWSPPVRARDPCSPAGGRPADRAAARPSPCRACRSARARRPGRRAGWRARTGSRPAAATSCAPSSRIVTGAWDRRAPGGAFRGRGSQRALPPRSGSSGRKTSRRGPSRPQGRPMRSAVPPSSSPWGGGRRELGRGIGGERRPRQNERASEVPSTPTFVDHLCRAYRTARCSLDGGPGCVRISVMLR